MTPDITISTAEELRSATTNVGAQSLIIRGHIANVPSFRLAPGQSLRGEDEQATITFASGADGVQLTTDNGVRAITLRTAPEQRAIYNETGVATLGNLEIQGVTTTGRVQILARDQVRAGHVEVRGLDIVAADARGETERPHGYGVYVLQGAFTLWNMQPDDAVVITADLVGISAGRNDAPVSDRRGV